MADGPIITVSAVSKVFDDGNGRGRVVEALRDIEFNAEPGELVCIVGPTGCGKTTLLRLLAGLDAPTSGAIDMKGKAPETARGIIGYVFQQSALFPWRRVLANVTFGLETKGMPRPERLARAREVLTLVGLADVENAYPYELSGGMQQRIAIARALAPRPEVMLMDEPFGALDERTRSVLQRELLAIHKETAALIVFVTHNIEEAVILADRIIVMATEPGRIAVEIPLDLPHPRNRMGDDFIRVMLEVRREFRRTVEETEARNGNHRRSP